jgi:leucyl aminopeptidase
LLTPKQLARLSHKMHEAGKCGGFEVLPKRGLASAMDALSDLSALVRRDRALELSRSLKISMEKRPEIEAALREVKEENIRASVEWLQAFPTRYNKDSTANAHVDQLAAKLSELVKGFKGNAAVELVSHTSTPQKSIRVRLEGTKRPSEIVVMGGHLDSIAGWGGGSRAPGADDNASGSSCLIEALRVLVARGPAERTIEFYWYAGEESGLLGSAEIARAYKAANKDVVGALQLDMTMFPGSGQLVIGNVDDFTSPWLRAYLVAMNDTYLGVRLIPDRCGYACSDHASWYRQGYPTLMPFESDTANMNRQIHTANDVISAQTSFAHAAVFAKIAVVMGMDLANSSARQP